MTDFYHSGQRKLQAEFQSTALADRLNEIIVKEHLDPEAQSFIQDQDHFYLTTVDADGFPTVSYKGGDAGFVRVQDDKTLLFPCFDGNGMWLSMGNIASHAKIGILFINAVKPHRIRVQGTARLIRDPKVLSHWTDVGLAVEVAITKTWFNCPRYIHPMTKLSQSEHVPRAHSETKQAEWKSLDAVADVLPPEPHTVNPG